MSNENSSQSNPFIAIMAKKTDAELAKILSVDKSQYNQDALNAAKEEYSKRDLKEDLVTNVLENLELQKENIKITTGMEASKWLRFLHLLIDMILIYTTAFLSMTVAVYFDFEYEGNPIMDRILFAIYIVCYYLGFESQLYTTPGKMLTQSTVVMENGEKPGFEVLAKRSLCRLIPFEVFFFLGAGSGWHDILSKTKVIRIK